MSESIKASVCSEVIRSFSPFESLDPIQCEAETHGLKSYEDDFLSLILRREKPSEVKTGKQTVVLGRVCGEFRVFEADGEVIRGTPRESADKRLLDLTHKGIMFQ